MSTVFGASPWTWVLAGVVLYWVAATALRSRGVLPESVRVQGPLLVLHTKRGRMLLERLARPRRFWRAWTTVGLVVAVVVMAATFVLLPLQAYVALTQPVQDQVTQPQNALVIPGVNEFIPLSAAPEVLAGLLVGLVVHEAGHGILCRVGDIDIESMGVVLLTLLPVGAFVEPEEESRDTADRLSRQRMFAAGVTNNFAVSVVALLLLFGPVTGAITVLPGVPVGDTVDGSPAAAAGIDGGDRVTAIDGTNVSNASELDAYLATHDRRNVTVTLGSGDTVEVSRFVFLTRVPARVDRALRDGGGLARVTAVAGERVHTRAGVRDALADDVTATVNTTKGSFDVVAGARVVGVNENSGFADATGLAGNQSVYVTRVAGERVVSTGDLQRVMDRTEPGETVAVEVYADGDRRTYTVTLGADGDGSGLLGVRLQPGVGGVTLEDFGVTEYPARGFLTALGGDAGGDGVGGFASSVLFILLLPIASTMNPTPYNFAGFDGFNTQLYAVPGLPDGPVFLLANVLFWTAWVNLNLGMFNCVPSAPLDGGHILRTATESVADRLPVERPDEAASQVTTTSSLLMLGSIVALFFGNQIAALLT
jgi:membrane-associated protease RseP (regulator of RpoE activity)